MGLQKTTKKTKSSVEELTEEKKNRLINFFRSSESYTSLILGIVVVIIATVLLLSFIHNRNTNDGLDQQRNQELGSVETTVEISPSETETQIEKDKQEKTYTVKAGDNLWKIAETAYNNGYLWKEIARINKLSNPSIVHVGDKLQLHIPNKEPKMMQNTSEEIFVPQEEKITGKSYKVKRGDNLWMIAVRAYGDGYKWRDLAKTNKLENPRIIHSDNTLKIPRE